MPSELPNEIAFLLANVTIISCHYYACKKSTRHEKQNLALNGLLIDSPKYRCVVENKGQADFWYAISCKATE